jgi:hypothetical protein
MTVDSWGVADVPDRPPYWDRWNLIREATLKPREKWMLMVISQRAGDDGDCVQPIGELASDMGLSTRQTSECLRGLVDAGLVTSVRSGRGNANERNINWAKLQDLRKPAGQTSPRPAETRTSKQPDDLRKPAGQETLTCGNPHIRTCGNPHARTAETRTSSLYTPATPQGNTPGAQRRASEPATKRAPSEKQIRDWCGRFAKDEFKHLDSGARRFAEFSQRFRHDWGDEYAAERDWLGSWQRTGREARTNPQQLFAKILIGRLRGESWGGDAEDEDRARGFQQSRDRAARDGPMPEISAAAAHAAIPPEDRDFAERKAELEEIHK